MLVGVNIPLFRWLLIDCPVLLGRVRKDANRASSCPAGAGATWGAAYLSQKLPVLPAGCCNDANRACFCPAGAGATWGAADCPGA